MEKFSRLFTTYNADSALLSPTGRVRDMRFSSVRLLTGLSKSCFTPFNEIKNSKRGQPNVRSLTRARPGCGLRHKGQCHTLLVHSFGLRAHNEAEEVLVRDGGPSDWGRGRSAALVIQTGALAELQKRRLC